MSRYPVSRLGDPRPHPGRIPMVKPPMQSSSGGGPMGAPSWGESGAPGMPPSEDAKRARDEMVQRYTLARGRFFERVFTFPNLQAISAAGSPLPNNTVGRVDVKSNGGSFVRCVAMRGTAVRSDGAGLSAGLELAQLFLLLSVDGVEDFTTSGQATQPVSYETLFSEAAAPWFWFAAPPLLRVSETLSATISTTFQATSGETQVTLTPQLTLRLIDDDAWCALYGS